MPYFVYDIKIHPESGIKHLTHLDTYDNYRSARKRVLEEREKAPERSAEELRMIFAKNQVEAEKLLSAPREERVIGDI